MLLWIFCVIVIPTAMGDANMTNSRPLSDEEKLMKRLFEDYGYNPSARPVLNSSHTVMVSMLFSLLQIQELDLKSQVLTTTGLLILEWTDERLVWDEDDIPLTELVIESGKLWTPEFATINGAEDIYGEYDDFRAVINSSGFVHWEPGGVFKTVCEIDITYYPFDEQHCKLRFGAWSYHTTKMNITSTLTEVNRDSYEPNGEWEILTTKAERNEFYFDCCLNERFAYVDFRLHLKRRYTFYIMNVILPSLMTSVLLLSIFFCTPAQKVQIGVVVLLSFRIFLLNVTDSIPKTSDHIPLLAIYLTITMAITTLSMVLTVLILNMHHISDRPVPPCLRRFMLGPVAKVLCMATSERRVKKQRAKNYRLKATIGSQLGLLLNGTALLSPDERDTAREPRSEQQERKAKEEEWAKDWGRVAEVLDRVFFWFFLTAILVTTLLLFHPLTLAYFSQLKNDND